MLVDESICDCCQTDVAIASSGPVVVYRDRTSEEIRDIYVTRLVNGEWTPGAPCTRRRLDDAGLPGQRPGRRGGGPGCDSRVVYGRARRPQGPGGVFRPTRVRPLGLPTRVDDGNPLGRVDVVRLRDGSALVAWMERGPEVAEIRVRRVTPDGGASSAAVVTTTSSGRDSGFPQMIQDATGRIVFAWTQTGDARQIRMARTMEAFE